MGIDGIQKQSETIKQQRVDTDNQSTRDVLNTIYHVEPPKRVASRLKYIWYALAIVIVALFAILILNNGKDRGVDTGDSGSVESTHLSGQFGNIDSNAWYAVHLTDEKVYYGRFTQRQLGTSLILTNVFYETSGNVTAQKVTTTVPAVTANRLVLVKLGTESHRPEDRMVISPDALIFFEKLKSDSPVVKAIEEYLER